MCHVSVLPDEWSTRRSPPLRHYWHVQVQEESLIPLSLARDYFRKPAFQIDLTQTPPVIGPYEASHD